MKKFKNLFSLIVCLSIVFTILSGITVSAATVNNITVTVNGRNIEFDVPPQLVNDRTMVPLRAIFEALEATVDWNNETETVTSKRDNTTISLTINDPIMYVNGEAIMLDSPACLIDGRTLVPVRAISEAFKAKVDWDNESETVIISTSNGIEVDSVYEGLQGSWFSREDSSESSAEEQIVINRTNYKKYCWTELVFGEPAKVPVQIESGTINILEDGNCSIDFDYYYIFNSYELKYCVDKRVNSKFNILALNNNTLTVDSRLGENTYVKGEIQGLKEKCTIALESVLSYTLEDFYLTEDLKPSNIRTVTSVTGAKCNFSELLNNSEKTADYYVQGYNHYRYEFEEETHHNIDSWLLYQGNNGKEIFLKYVDYLKNEKGFELISCDTSDYGVTEYQFAIDSIRKIFVAFSYIPKHSNSWIDVYLKIY